jgi:hypothetical protein
MHSSQDSFYPNSPCYAEFYGPQCLSIECGDMAKARLDKCLLTHNEIDPTPFSQTDRLKLKMPSSDLEDFLDFPNQSWVNREWEMGQKTDQELIAEYGLNKKNILEPQAENPLFSIDQVSNEFEQTRSEKIETIFVPEITERFTIQREKSNGKLEKFIMFGVIGLALFLLK